MKKFVATSDPTSGRRGLARWGRNAIAVALSAMVLPAWGLDLKQAYEAALARDATVRAARAATDAARETLPQARSQLLPNVSASLVRNSNDLKRTQGNLLGQETTTNEDYFSYNQTLQLRQPLYRKPLFAGLKQARHIVDDAEAVLDFEVQNVGIRVTEAYMEALLAQDQLDLIRKQRESVLVRLDAARRALQLGSGIRTDVDAAQARLDMNTALELEASQNVDLTRRQLEVLIGQPVGELVPLDSQRLPLLPPDPARVDAWIDLAEASSPEIQAHKARVEAARVEVEKARGGHHPTLDAVAQLSRSGSENVTSPNTRYTNRMLGLQVSIPIYAGGYVSSTVRQAIAEQTRAEELLEVTRRDLAVRLHREHRGVTEGVLRVRALEQAVRSGEQLLLSSQRSFDAGSRTIVDVLNADDELQTVQRDLAQARYRYLISRIRLQALAGGDREQAISEVNGWLASR